MDNCNTYTGDTYLYGDLNGAQVAFSDDGCGSGLGSKVSSFIPIKNIIIIKIIIIILINSFLSR